MRAGMFSALGLFGAIPIIHQWAIHSGIWHVRISVVLEALMGFLYLVSFW